MGTFRAKKSLGQHFLTNPKVVDTMVEAARLNPGDTVLEIGPGTGVLTEGLLASGARVIALEADMRAIEVLWERFATALKDGSLTLHHTDVREKAPSAWVEEDVPYTVVANIPYYLSGTLIRTTLTDPHQPARVVFLVQKEVAERIARSTKESLLSLSVKAYGTPRYVRTVPRGSFSPAPAVDSAVLAIDDISRARFKTLDEAWFFTVLKAGFAARRKTLLGNLSILRERTVLAEHFAALHIPLDVRGEDLSIEQWCALAEALA